MQAGATPQGMEIWWQEQHLVVASWVQGLRVMEALGKCQLSSFCRPCPCCKNAPSPFPFHNSKTPDLPTRAVTSYPRGGIHGRWGNRRSYS